MTFKKVGAFESETRPDGGDETRREFTVKGHKVREGGEADSAELLIVKSGRAESRALEWMRVESGGAVTNRRDDMCAEIAEFVCNAGRTLTTKEVADGVDEDAEDATFRRALKAACEGKAAQVEKVKRGRYGPRIVTPPSELAEGI
jgi:hypothetical protein